MSASACGLVILAVPTPRDGQPNMYSVMYSYCIDILSNSDAPHLTTTKSYGVSQVACSSGGRKQYDPSSSRFCTDGFLSDHIFGADRCNYQSSLVHLDTSPLPLYCLNLRPPRSSPAHNTGNFQNSVYSACDCVIADSGSEKTDGAIFALLCTKIARWMDFE